MPEKNSLYEPAWKVYEPNPHAGEPLPAEDGYIPRNRNAKPWLLGTMPAVNDLRYPVLNDPVLIKKKNELRQALKEEYKKQLYNPYRHATGAGGTPFDSGIQRYVTMLRTQIQFFRPSFKVTAIGISLYFLPVIIGYQVLMHYKGKEERMYRSGKVAYKDRDYQWAC